MAFIKKKKLDPKKATNEQFIASSIIRFGRLNNYIQEKLIQDYFAIEGNLNMMKGIENFIENNLDELKKLK